MPLPTYSGTPTRENEQCLRIMLRLVEGAGAAGVIVGLAMGYTRTALTDNIVFPSATLLTIAELCKFIHDYCTCCLDAYYKDVSECDDRVFGGGSITDTLLRSNANESNAGGDQDVESGQGMTPGGRGRG